MIIIINVDFITTHIQINTLYIPILVLCTGDPLAQDELFCLERYRLAVNAELVHVIEANGLPSVSLPDPFTSVVVIG